MSQSVHPHTKSAFVKQLIALDGEIVAKIQNDGKSVEEIYQMYLDRLSLFERSCIMPLNENDKILLQSRKEDIYLEFKLYNMKQNVKKHNRWLIEG